MTFTLSSPSADAPMSPPTISTWTGLAQRCLSLALRFDYLSGGRGHQQSRQVLQDRFTTASKSATARRNGDFLHASLSAKTALASNDSERRYLAEISVKPRLTSREEYCLVARMREGDRAAYETLIEGNLGLVVMFARRYQRPCVPLLDLIAEGNMGLMRAAERFDPERGCRFATYAKWWVLQSIQQALPKLTSVVRIPIAQTKNSAKVAREAAADRHAPLDLVDNGLMGGDDEAEHDDASDTDRSAMASEPTDASAADREGRPLVAFHDERFETSDADVLDSIAIDPEHEPPAATMARQRIRVLQRALDTLNERDRSVIAARFALEDDCVCTLDELATRFGVSIERIRQIESAAVKSLERALRRAGESANSLL